MRITLCGTGAGVNTALRANAGIVLQANGSTIMLDCGGGSVREAVRSGLTIRDIEAVCLSHLHQDHCIDLAVLLGDRAFGRMTPPAVYGPKGVELFTRSAAFHVKTSALDPKNDVPGFGEVADGEQRDVCGFAVRWGVTPHAPDLVAMAQRFEADGRSVVYSGDTRAAPEVMVPLAQEADVLIHECFSNERMQRVIPTVAPEIAVRLGHFRDVHSEVRDVAAIARDAGVKRLVLTHLLSGEEPDELQAIASSIFGGEVVVAYDGMSLEV
jgi:ribonuclease BN (tRNA processing enzyme)